MTHVARNLSLGAGGLALLATGFYLDGQPAAAVDAETPIRIMAANLTSGSNYRYETPGIHIFQGLDPDIIMIQEFNYGTSSAADLRAFVDLAFGPEFSYFREVSTDIPNGIISRYPIKSAGEWDDTYVSNRDFVWARIDIPGSKDLWAVSVHLLTSDSGSRNKEATQLVSYLTTKGIPASDYLVIGGDLNTSSRTESCITTFSKVVNTASPYPVDQKNNGNTNAGRSKPYDWVMVDADLKAWQIPVLEGSNTFTNGLVFDSRTYTPLTDVSPVVSSDSGASGMQHMAVVKDFLVPNDDASTPIPTPTPTPTPTPPPTSTVPTLIISEIMYYPTTSAEWIEIYNYGTAAVSLDNVYLTDNEGVDLNEGEYYFPTGTMLQPGDFVVVGAATASYVDYVWPSGLALSNLGDEVYLVLDSDRNGLFTSTDVLDGLKYANTWGGSGTGYSLSRLKISSTTNQSSSWGSSTTLGGTPNAKNNTW